MVMQTNAPSKQKTQKRVHKKMDCPINNSVRLDYHLTEKFIIKKIPKI